MVSGVGRVGDTCGELSWEAHQPVATGTETSKPDREVAEERVSTSFPQVHVPVREQKTTLESVSACNQNQQSSTCASRTGTEGKLVSVTDPRPAHRNAWALLKPALFKGLHNYFHYDTTNTPATTSKMLILVHNGEYFDLKWHFIIISYIRMSMLALMDPRSSFCAAPVNRSSQ